MKMATIWQSFTNSHEKFTSFVANSKSLGVYASCTPFLIPQRANFLGKTYVHCSFFFLSSCIDFRSLLLLACLLVFSASSSNRIVCVTPCFSAAYISPFFSCSFRHPRSVAPPTQGLMLLLLINVKKCFRRHYSNFTPKMSFSFPRLSPVVSMLLLSNLSPRSGAAFLVIAWTSTSKDEYVWSNRSTERVFKNMHWIKKGDNWHYIQYSFIYSNIQILNCIYQSSISMIKYVSTTCIIS